MAYTYRVGIFVNDANGRSLNFTQPPTITVWDFDNETQIMTPAPTLVNLSTGFYKAKITIDTRTTVAFKVVPHVDDQAAVEDIKVMQVKAEQTVEDIPADVWDRALTGATHNIATSAGRRLRELGTTVITTNTAQGGGANYITLDAGASATDEIYDENLITIIAGTGIGQSRLITDYDGTTKRAYVNRIWEINPDATSEYQIVGFAAPTLTHHGLAQGGTANTITLDTSASATSSVYNGQLIFISTSTGAGQVRIITAYNGTTKVATVGENWCVNPDNTSVYKIIPFADIWTSPSRTLTQAATSITAAVSGSSITDIRGNSWSISVTDLTLSGTIHQFAIKRHASQPDADAILFIDTATGLITVNGAAVVDAAQAGLDYTGTTLTITVDAEITAQLPAGSYVYGIQTVSQDSASTTVSELYSGVFTITADVVRATS